MTFAEMTGAHVYIVHLSCKEALDEAIAARQRGVNVWVETLIQYLLLDKNLRRAAGFRRREIRHVAAAARQAQSGGALERACAAGSVHTVATDHAPFDFKTQKPMGRDDFTKIPNGIPSLEDRVKSSLPICFCPNRTERDRSPAWKRSHRAGLSRKLPGFSCRATAATSRSSRLQSSASALGPIEQQILDQRLHPDIHAALRAAMASRSASSQLVCTM